MPDFSIVVYHPPILNSVLPVPLLGIDSSYSYEGMVTSLLEEMDGENERWANPSTLKAENRNDSILKTENTTLKHKKMMGKEEGTNIRNSTLNIKT